MCCYRRVINHIKIWSLWWNKTGILPNCVRVSSTIRLHHLDSNVLFWTNPGSSTHKIIARPLPVSQAIQVRWTRDAGESKEELISNVLLWTTTHGHTSMGHPSKTYILQLYADTDCRLEDLSRVMVDKDRERELKEPVLSSRHDINEWTMLKSTDKFIFSMFFNFFSWLICKHTWPIYIKIKLHLAELLIAFFKKVLAM